MTKKFRRSGLLTFTSAAAIFLAIMSPLHAENPDCSDPGQLTQRGMNYCATEEFNAADQDLNAAWKSVFSEIKSRDAQQGMEDRMGWPDAVLKAQRIWIDFRDAHCGSAGFAYRGGSIEPLIYQTCRTQLTRQRIEQINGLVDE